MFKKRRIERPDEGDLHEDVDRAADQDREDHRARHVAVGFLRLARELHRLLEAEQREDDTAARNADQDRLHRGAVNEEATAGGEVAAVEVPGQEDGRRQQRDQRSSMW